MNDDILQHIYTFCDIDTQLSLRKAYSDTPFRQPKIKKQITLEPFEFYDENHNFLDSPISYLSYKRLHGKNYVYSSNIIKHKYVSVLSNHHQIINELCEYCDYPSYEVFTTKDHVSDNLGNITIFTPIGKVCITPTGFMYDCKVC